MDTRFGIAFKSINAFIYTMLSLNPLFLLINYLNYLYGEQLNEPYQFQYLAIVDKFVLTIYGLLVLFIIKRRASPFGVYITIIVTALITFEFHSFCKPKYYAYIVYSLFYSFSKSLSLSGIKFKQLMATNILTYEYHMIRFIINKTYDKSFPLFIALILWIDLVGFDIPYAIILKKYQMLFENQENIIKDFNTMLEMMPDPVFVARNANNFKGVLYKNKSASDRFNDDDIIHILKEFTSNIANLNLKICYQTYKTFNIRISCEKLRTSIYGEHCSVIVTDVTEITQKEKKEASENAQWLFANTTKHQIRTPLWN